MAQAWEQAHQDGWEWNDMTSYVTHQISNAHTNAIIEAVGIERERIPLTFPKWGNGCGGSADDSPSARRPTRRATVFCAWVWVLA